MAAAMKAHADRVTRKRALLAAGAVANPASAAERMAALRRRVETRRAAHAAASAPLRAAHAATRLATGPRAERAHQTAAEHAAAAAAWHACEDPVGEGAD